MRKYLLSIVCTFAILPAAFADDVQRNIPPGTTWYWQLSGTPDLSHHAAKLYDIDLEDTPATLISQLRSAGHQVICYFSAGSYEPWRHDAPMFPPSTIGNKLQDWSEYYIDIRDPTIRDIMRARMDSAKRKGCSGFEPDVVDAFANPSGFAITRQQEIDYIKWLGVEGHQRGLLVALKNSPELVSDLVDATDLVIAEQCFQYGDCRSYLPFIAQGKAVLLAEYSAFSPEQCRVAKALRFSLAFFDVELSGRLYRSCD